MFLLIGGEDELDPAIVEVAKAHAESNDAALVESVRTAVTAYINDNGGDILANASDDIDPEIVEAAKEQIQAARSDPSHPLRQALVDSAARRLEEQDE